MLTEKIKRQNYHCPFHKNERVCVCVCVCVTLLYTHKVTCVAVTTWQN